MKQFILAIVLGLLTIASICHCNVPVKPAVPCKDEIPFLCLKHKTQGHCEQPRWKHYMEMICPKSCEQCAGAGSECKDVNTSFCAQRKKHGQCKGLMTQNLCRKTCRVCK